MDPNERSELIAAAVAISFICIAALINYIIKSKRLKNGPFDTVKVAIVDRGIPAEGVARLLHQSGFDIVFKAMNLEQMMEGFVGKDTPDIILLTSNEQVLDGIAAVKWLKQNHPSVKILVFYMMEQHEISEQMILEGANGSLIFTADPQVIIEAVRTIIRTGVFRYRPTREDRMASTMTLQEAREFINKNF